MDESEIEVNLICNLPALRVMYKIASDAYQTWPGGDPEEQVALERLKTSLYVCLMESLLHNDKL